jgi:hypothetical protein
MGQCLFTLYPQGQSLSKSGNLSEFQTSVLAQVLDHQMSGVQNSLQFCLSAGSFWPCNAVYTVAWTTRRCSLIRPRSHCPIEKAWLTSSGTYGVPYKQHRACASTRRRTMYHSPRVLMDFHSFMQEPINVSGFQAASAPVTMGEFYQFAVLEGGYARPELWKPCDFDFFRSRGQTLPATWSSQVIPYSILPFKQPVFSGTAANN